VIVTGTAKVVPCGVNANIWPVAVNEVGNAGAPAVTTSMRMRVSLANAPAGITTLAPLGPVTVPPAAPITVPAGGGGGGVGADGGDGGDGGGAVPSPPPQAARPRNDAAMNRPTSCFVFMSTILFPRHSC